MKHLLIGKTGVIYAQLIGGGTISGFNQANQLDNGAIALFTPDGALITVANSATILQGYSDFYMAVGSGVATTGAKVSPFVRKNMDLEFTKQAYSAPVNQISFIGQNSLGGGSMFLPSLIPGTEAIITIVDTTTLEGIVTGVNQAYKQRYSYTITASDTNLSVVNNMIAIINADQLRVVNATAIAGGLGIQLTAINATVTNLIYNNDQTGTPFSFGIAVDEAFINASVYATGLVGIDGSVSAFAGFGTPNELLVLQDETSYYEGKSQGIMLPQIWWQVPSLVDTTATYDTYVGQWSPKHVQNMNYGNATQQELIIALPNGATAQANLETILTNLGVYA